MDMTYSSVGEPSKVTEPQVAENSYLQIREGQLSQLSSKGSIEERLSTQFTPEQIQLLSGMLEELRVKGRKGGGGATPPRQRSNDIGKLYAQCRLWPPHTHSSLGYLVAKTSGSLSDSM